MKRGFSSHCSRDHGVRTARGSKLVWRDLIHISKRINSFYVLGIIKIQKSVHLPSSLDSCAHLNQQITCCCLWSFSTKSLLRCMVRARDSSGLPALVCTARASDTAKSSDPRAQGHLQRRTFVVTVFSRDISVLEAEGQRQRICWHSNCEGFD